jgi:hypothetical protein
MLLVENLMVNSRPNPMLIAAPIVVQSLLLPMRKNGGVILGGAAVGQSIMDDWSDCGQIYFLDNYAWGTMETGQRVCLGKADIIREFLKSHQIPDDMPVAQRKVLSFIKDYREENGFGKPRTDSVDGKGFMPSSRNHKTTTNITKARKRSTIHKVKSKNQTLSQG